MVYTQTKCFQLSCNKVRRKTVEDMGCDEKAPHNSGSCILLHQVQRLIHSSFRKLTKLFIPVSICTFAPWPGSVLTNQQQ
jgi:hypothetical protein